MYTTFKVSKPNNNLQLYLEFVFKFVIIKNI